MSIRVNCIKSRLSDDLFLGLFFFDSTKNRVDDFSSTLSIRPFYLPSSSLICSNTLSAPIPVNKGTAIMTLSFILSGTAVVEITTS